MQSRQYKIGLIQMQMDAQLDRNVRHAVEMIRDAAGRGAKVICTPELFRSHYFCQCEDVALFDLAEPVPGPTTATMQALAKELGVVLVVSVFERRAAGLYHNTAVTIDADGQIVGLYRKMHIPDDPAYYEKFYFTPGDLGFPAYDTGVARVATLVCWDQWYPEAARLAALQGPSVLFYPTAIGWHPKEKDTLGPAQRNAWQTIQRSHAIANGLYVAAVNRVGHEVTVPGTPGLIFWGSSFVSDPGGTVIAEAPADQEAVLVAEVNLATIEEIRRGWPFLRDRRIDAYAGLQSRWLQQKKE